MKYSKIVLIVLIAQFKHACPIEIHKGIKKHTGIPTSKPLKKEPAHYLIEFAQPPSTEEQHYQWIEAIEKSIEEVNTDLKDKGILPPEEKNQISIDQSFTEKIKKIATNFYYDMVFRENSITHPRKRNYAFIARRTDILGCLSVHVPDSVSRDLFKKTLRDKIYKYGVPVRITPDHPLYKIGAITPQPESFAHISFTPGALDKLRTHELVAYYEQKESELRSQIQKTYYSSQILKDKLTDLTKTTAILKKLEPFIFWYQEIPTTGIRLKGRMGTYAYPFLPHLFPLWEMAPTLGEGINTVVIDSGIAAFDIKNYDKFKKNADLAMNANFNTSSYNMVNQGSLDALEQFLTMFRKFLVPALQGDYSHVDLEENITTWIHEYLEHKTMKGVTDWLRKYGKLELFGNKNREKAFSEEGKRALRTIEHSDEGFHPKGREANFHHVELLDKKTGKSLGKAILEYIPTAPILPNKKTFSIGHGSHVAGIIAGRLATKNVDAYLKASHYQPLAERGVCGIAPRANIIMIKAFSDEDKGWVSVLISALKKAVSLDAPIVNMSLKMSDYLDPHTQISQTLTTLLNLVPYPIVASGNDGDPTKQSGYPGEFESYPARFDFIPFDIGAFAYDPNTQTCPVTNFSQFQKNVGPKFVAPGHNILNCGLVDYQTEDTMYVFMDGTSMAAPIMSGFTALMLGEFQNDFSREELLKTCYSSGIRMHDDDKGWKEKTLLGALDMRTVLFTLHVIRKLKKEDSTKKINFDILLQATHEFIFGMANEYSKEHLDGLSLKNNFMPFFTASKKKKYTLPSPLNTLEKSIQFVVDALLYSVSSTHSKPELASLELIKKVKEVLKKKLTFIKTIVPTAQNRIQAVFDSGQQAHKEFVSNSSTYFGKLKSSSQDVEKLIQSTYPLERYWKEQITKLKQVAH